MMKRNRLMVCMLLAVAVLPLTGCIEAVRVGFTSGLESGISGVIEQLIGDAASGISGGAE